MISMIGCSLRCMHVHKRTDVHHLSVCLFSLYTAAAAVLALYLGFGSSLTGNAAELELAYAQPLVTTQSSKQALSLAHR